MIYLLFIVLALAIIAAIITLNAFITILWVRVPYVPTPNWAIQWMANNLDLKPSSYVYDLGCGDGRILFAMEKKFSNLKLTGFELAWLPYFITRLKIIFKKSKIKLLHKNFYKADLSNADLIFCFLIDSVMPKLEKQLKEQLKHGARVISYGFKFPNWQPSEVIVNPKKPKGSKINIYQV